MALSRLKQVAATVETTPGTFNSGVYAAANAKHRITQAAVNLDIPLFQRDNLRETLTPEVGLPGKQMAALSMSIELAGEASSGTPSWSNLLRACGMRALAQSKATIGAVTGGPFRHGETITGGTSSATATVIHDTYDGTTTIYIGDISGTFTAGGETVTGGTSSATATLTGSTVASAGLAWYPQNHPETQLSYSGSDPSVDEVLTGGTSGAKGIITYVNSGTLRVRIYNALQYSNTEALTASSTGSIGTASSISQLYIPSLSLALYEDGVRTSLAGCRGSWKLDCRLGEPAILSFDFKGLYESVDDASNLSGISYDLKVPPTFLSAAAILSTEAASPTTYTPRFNSLSLDQGNTVEYREDANDSTGILEAVITNRNGTGTIDPELDLETSYPVVGNFVAGTPSRLTFDVGGTNGNKFHFSCPGVVYSGTPSGDRAGFATRELPFSLTGGTYTNDAGDAGMDNEVVISYITA